MGNLTTSVITGAGSSALSASVATNTTLGGSPSQGARFETSDAKYMRTVKFGTNHPSTRPDVRLWLQQQPALFDRLANVESMMAFYFTPLLELLEDGSPVFPSTLAHDSLLKESLGVNIGPVELSHAIHGTLSDWLPVLPLVTMVAQYAADPVVSAFVHYTNQHITQWKSKDLVTVNFLLGERDPFPSGGAGTLPIGIQVGPYVLEWKSDALLYPKPYLITDGCAPLCVTKAKAVYPHSCHTRPTRELFVDISRFLCDYNAYKLYSANCAAGAPESADIFGSCRDTKVNTLGMLASFRYSVVPGDTNWPLSPAAVLVRDARDFKKDDLVASIAELPSNDSRLPDLRALLLGCHIRDAWLQTIAPPPHMLSIPCVSLTRVHRTSS